MKMRKIDVEVKISVVLEGLKGKVSVAKLCCKGNIWKRESRSWMQGC